MSPGPMVSLDGGAMLKILEMQKFTPKRGDVVVARITRWPTLKHSPAGTLLEVLGAKDDPGVDFKEVLRRHNLSTAFPASVESEAASFGTEVPESVWQDELEIWEWA